MLAANANALTASGMAAYAAQQLRAAGFYQDADGIAEAAAECLTPLLRAAAIALELAGLRAEDRGGALHDIILDYIAVDPPAIVEAEARRVA